MKLLQVFINRESVALYIAFCDSLKHLYIGAKNLIFCIMLLIIYIPIFILELLTWFIIRPLKKNKFWSRD